jgi:hypothetical protein
MKAQPIPFAKMSFRRPVASQASPSTRQVISDVAMLAGWAALIPGMMWIGSVVGF